MATAPLLTERTRPIRREEWERMASIGLFEGERVELLYGAIVQMSPKGTRHESAIERLNELLVTTFKGRARVRVQSSFAASDSSQPEPDLAVVPLADYRDDHPKEAFLLVEVSDSSLPVDRKIKAQLYAEANVPEYWIVNVRDAIIEVHTEIVRGEYTKVIPYRAGSRIALVRFPDVSFAADEIL